MLQLWPASEDNLLSMKGYQCKNKTAKEILETLGYDPTIANRGWVLERTSGFSTKGNSTPLRMHALIQTDAEGSEYIDVHADLQGPNDTHITHRGRRTERWNEIFEQIDHDQSCDAGHKLLSHYGKLSEALEKYHDKKPNQR